MIILGLLLYENNLNLIWIIFRTAFTKKSGIQILFPCRHPGAGYPMMVGYPMMAPPQLAHIGPLLMPGTGSIRSVQSVPMLSHHTWDGEPCPVHHQHGHGHGPMVPLAALYGQ